MPRVAKELSALDLRRLKHDGSTKNKIIAVGGVAGLLLQITPNGGRSWLLRVSVGERRREIGLGGFPDVTLAQARERARDAKDKVRRGIDPVDERRAAKSSLIASRRRGLSFSEATDRCLASKLDAFRNAKHRDQWRNTIETYAMPELGQILVDEITVQDVLRVLQPIWLTKTETASRLRGRIEAVLSWSTVSGFRVGDNPARWRGNLKELLPAAAKVAKKGNHPAVQIEDAARWFGAIQGRDGMGSRALEFTALTAVRSKEVRGAQWEEIDLEGKMWIIPAVRMKMDREHRIPLAPQAVALLKNLPRFQHNPLVFPAPRGGTMSDMTLSAAMKRLHEADLANGKTGYVDRVSKRPAVPHGLRSTFRDWVAESTNFQSEMAEVAMAHKVGNAVEAAYRRGDMVEKRRTMMTVWAEFLTGSKQDHSNIIRLA